MVATITFRLRSSDHVGVIDVPHQVISCREVKEAIAEQLKGSPDEIDIFLSESSGYLHPDEDLKAYSTVEVVRHVASGRPPVKRERESTTSSAATGGGGGGKRGNTFNSNSTHSRRNISRIGNNNNDNNNNAAPLTEEDRLAQLSEAVAADTGIDEVQGWRQRQMRSRPMGNNNNNLIREDSFRPPPRGYICHNCGKGGHLIQHCPAAKGPRGLKLLSLPTGIPETMLVECTMDDPAAKFVTRDGRLVKRRLDNSCFTKVVTTPVDITGITNENFNNNENDNVINNNTENEMIKYSSSATLESKYFCKWDMIVAKNAMKTPCCSVLLCESCFNEKVEEMISRDNPDEEPLLCPGCNKPLCVPDVIPALEERKVIEALQSLKR